MIRKEIDIHLEALAGYINDEDKMVTYKWLSKELDIHVNLSKQILFEYWDNQRNDKNPVTATFLIIGYLDDGEMRVEVVKEADLSSAKEKFSKLISEHIYSLQKTLPEIELLAIADKGDSQQSGVRCTESVIRSENEMEILRWGCIIPSNKEKTINVKSTTSKIDKRTITETKTTEQIVNTSKESATKTSDKTQKSAFNNLFAKAIDKQNKDTKSKGKLAKNSPPKNPWFEATKKSDNIKEQTKKSNDIVEPTVGEKTSVLAAVTGNNSESSLPKKNSWFEGKNKSKIVKEKAEISQSTVTCKVDDKIKGESPDGEKICKNKSPDKSIGTDKIRGKKEAASTLRGKKRQSSVKNESTSKKRKRIVIVESSDESSSSEMEDIREPDSPEEPKVIEKIKSPDLPPLTKCEGGRRKVRKLVDKTFFDEDGYFVTEKEYVYESCSDKEEEVQPDIAKPSTSEATVKNLNKRKQATLLNFFKKS